MFDVLSNDMSVGFGGALLGARVVVIVEVIGGVKVRVGAVQLQA